MKKIGLFLLCLGSVFLISLFLLHRYTYPVETLKINPKQNILVMGDSQIECALNVGLIKNTYSVAQGGDHHLFSYAQLRNMIKQNQNIDTVILGYNYNNVLDSYQYYYKTSSIIQYKIPKYYSLFQVNELLDIAAYYPKAMTTTLPLILKYNINLFLKRKIEINDLNLGGYVEIKNGLKKPANKIVKLDKVKYSSIQEKYLKQIVKLCNDNNIKLILLATPNQHSTQLFSKKFINHFNDVKFKDVTLYNFTDMKLDSTCFYDFVHLNQKGASIFTTYFRDSILHHHD